ncbi:MAG: prepilin-type N-terminal cleavage/methylation domain-containing protein [Ruminococcus sp.]|nr:prepilin-type N-terminal cleavage/methylation domain-containing protein [Ruminococcus sp.]
MLKTKNSKKGFTLVELVVVIAILAILAAIAIPVVASTIKSAQVSSSKSNAQTIELAIKEAQAALSTGDNAVFPSASTGKITLAEVATTKKIASAMSEIYTIDGKEYKCHWDKSDDKVYYVNGTTDTDGGTHTGTDLVYLDPTSNCNVGTWTSIAVPSPGGP